MNKIESLIDQLVPKGVARLRLGEVADFQRGTTITKSTTSAGNIPVLAGGQTPAYFHGESNRYGENVVVAGSGAYAGHVSFWIGPIWVSDAFTVKPKTNNLLTKYLYYFLKSRQDVIHNLKQGAGVPHVYGKDVAKIEIPMPPEEIQVEIIRILDNFTDLVTELEVELESRKKQYEFYRNQFLTSLSKEVRWVPMGDVITYKQPGPYLVKSTDYSENFATPVLTAGKTFVLGYTNETEGIYEASKSAPTIIFDDFTTSSKWVDFRFKAKSSAMKMLVPKVESLSLKFAFFYLQTLNFVPKEHARHWIGTFAKMQMPLPALEDQLKIVEQLDNFEALVGSLSVGLPAELNARRKQYEYYRGKLLTFKEWES